MCDHDPGDHGGQVEGGGGLRSRGGDQDQDREENLPGQAEVILHQQVRGY